MRWVLAAVGAIAALAGLVFLIGVLLPQNHTASRSARFQQAPLDIWDAITGPPTWRPEIARVDKLAPRNGHRTWKEIDKHGGAITYEAVEELAPTHLITRIANPDLPYGGIWIYEIEFGPGACILTITEDGEVYNPIYRFMSRFVFGYTATIDAYLKALRAKFGETD